MERRRKKSKITSSDIYSRRIDIERAKENFQRFPRIKMPIGSGSLIRVDDQPRPQWENISRRKADVNALAIMRSWVESVMG